MHTTKLAQITQLSHSRAKLSAAGVLLIMLALIYACVHIYSVHRALSASENEMASFKRGMAEADSRRQAEIERGASLQKDLTEREKQIEKLSTLALAGLGQRNPGRGDIAALNDSLRANELVEGLARTGTRRRANVTLRYYPYDFERYMAGDVVLARFKRQGFEVDARSERQSPIAPNALWAGALVDAEDLRLVALTLAAAGVRIKSLRPFRENTDDNERVIEIGSDPTEAGAPALDLDTLAAAPAPAPKEKQKETKKKIEAPTPRAAQPRTQTAQEESGLLRLPSAAPVEWRPSPKRHPRERHSHTSR